MNNLTPKTTIIGAGPAGLSAAYVLSKAGKEVEVLEQDKTYVGGLSRTVVHKGYYFDIGGHRFFSKSQEVEDFWSEILGDELLTRQRLSRIHFNEKFFKYPIQLGDAFRKLGPFYSTSCFLSYLISHIYPRSPVTSFEDWIVNNFGEKLFRTFFKTYTEKVWGIPTSELNADWAAQRIPELSMLTLLKSILIPKQLRSRNSDPVRTLIEEFRYPRFGPGQMWERVMELVSESGNIVALDQKVYSIRWGNSKSLTMEVRDSLGNSRCLESESVISSMPLRSLIRSLSPEAPIEIVGAAERLKYRNFLIVALILDQESLFPDNWLYVHDPGVSVGRIQNFKNWSPDLVPDSTKTCIGMEYFCSETDELWTMPDQELVELALRELRELGIGRRVDVVDSCVVRAPKAYPVYDQHYRKNIDTVRSFVENRLPQIQLIGRSGMHRYNNQDHAAMTGFAAAENVLKGSRVIDVWKVNEEAVFSQ